MNSYLSLIPISAKVHKRQNRMTILCIVFAVFLVTAIFSMADMGIRMEIASLLKKHETQELIAASRSTTAQALYSTAAVLFVLILLAGVLMISSSINSNVSQRTKFFGMMRCIGMSKSQIIHYVRLEALNWCKVSIPIGIILGIITTWILCAVLRFYVGNEFLDIPLFGISIIGILSGIIMGVVTVLIAASSPAKRAAKISPASAVSGNIESITKVSHISKAGFFKIETALGINHAISLKKNFILMTGSFAFSIILFLSFSVFIDLVNYIMPQSSNTSDIAISSNNGSNSIDNKLLNKISNMTGVKCAFGRRSYLDMPVHIYKDNYNINSVDLISFGDFDLKCLDKDNMLKRGSDIEKVHGNSNYVLLIEDEDTPFTIGDSIQLRDTDVIVAGLLKYNIFSEDGCSDGKLTIIASDETFTRLTDINDYSLILIQTTKDITDENISSIRGILDIDCSLKDNREQRTTNYYIAFLLFIYGFLTIIAMVTVLSIMNSISMSVTARIKQYGAMRAVGMSEHQITKMIIAEAFTYALSGCLCGCALGLLISKLLYDDLITSHYSFATWKVPVIPLFIILSFVFVSVCVSIYAPSKRIHDMKINETINEL